MTIAQAIPLVAEGSMMLIMFAVALQGSFADVGYLLRRPGLLVRSLVAMNVVMPLFAIGLAAVFELKHAIEVALFTLALAPLPPILPKKELKAGGRRPYVIGLLTAAALFSIVFVPVAAHLAGLVAGRPVEVSPLTVAKIVATSILLPLVAGVAVGRFAPALAARIAGPLSAAGTILLILAFVPVLIGEWPAIVALFGDFTLVVIVVFVAVGLVIGHALGGPDPGERTVLALARASRHPAIGVAVAHNVPDRPALLAAVLLTLVVGGVVCVPYVKWRRRNGAGVPSASQAR
jgi:BASS family bile acid:Na+ symporter